MADSSGPKVLTFPLWRGQDTVFTARRKDPVSGNYVHYAPGTTAKIIFTSGSNVVEIEAKSISGGIAYFDIKSADVENVRGNATWRVQFTVNGRDESPVIGKVVRKDV